MFARFAPAPAGTRTPTMPAPVLRRRGLPGLLRDSSGMALTEFAMVLPFLMILATSGLELTNYAITVKRVGELAVMVADNASRMGAQSVINNKPISEAEINDVFIGADLAASGMALTTNGRIILSSLQPKSSGSYQTIKWQRCYGALAFASPSGTEGKGESDDTLSGMGPSSNPVAAAAGTQVMVVEIKYRYKRLMPLIWLPLDDIQETSAFNVRDSRDPGMPTNSENVTASTCPV